MKIETDSVRGAFVLRPVGTMDARTCPAVKASFDAVLERGIELVRVDLSGVSFMDSSGLGTLVAMAKGAQRSSVPLRLERLPEQALMLVKATGLDRFLPIDSESRP